MYVYMCIHVNLTAHQTIIIKSLMVERTCMLKLKHSNTCTNPCLEIHVGSGRKPQYHYMPMPSSCPDSFIYMLFINTTRGSQ